MKLQCELNPQPHKLSSVEVRVSIGKEYNPERWYRNVWAHPTGSWGYQTPENCEVLT